MFNKAKYVYAVYREGSFTRAAKKLYISQPCLSTAIRRLEERIGMPLFERGAEVKPTAVGLEYIRTAEKLFAVEASFESYLMEIAATQSGGEVRIGAESYVFSHILLELVEKMNELYPSLTFSLTEASSMELFRLLTEGELDLIVDSYDKEEPSLSYIPLRQEKILLAVPSEDGGEDGYSVSAEEVFEGKLNTGMPKAVSISEFHDRKFVLLKSGNSMYDHAMAAFKTAGFTPKIAMLFDQLSNSIRHAEEMGAVCFATDTIFICKRSDSRLRLYRIEECCDRMLGVITLKKTKSSVAVDRFIALLKERVKESF